jgi:phenylacetate-CoA ligase
MSATLAFVERIKRHVVGENLVRRNPFYYERSRRLLDKLSIANFEERSTWTRCQLARTLRLARFTSYGKLVRGGETLESWPMLDKELLRNRLHAFTTGSDWFSAPANTGGTRGVPLKLVRSFDGVVFEQACIDRLVVGLGLCPRTVRTAVLRGDNLQDPRTLALPDGVSANGGRSRIFCARSVSPQNFAHLVDTLEKFAPQLLCAYPNALESLCRMLADQGRKLKIPAVLTSSEVLNPVTWELAQDVLGCHIADYYGQAERIAFAYATAPREYRFLAGYSYLEFLPYETKLLPAGATERLYEVVGTSFWNNLMPLVRYRTGDLIRLPAEWGARELEELGCGMRTFRGILGRQQEILACPTGVRVTGLDSIPDDVDHVLRVQVVQESVDSACIRVVPAPGFTDADAANLLRNARASVPEGVRLRVEIANCVERTPRGKAPLVVHRPPVHEALRRAGVEPPLVAT